MMPPRVSYILTLGSAIFDHGGGPEDARDAPHLEHAVHRPVQMPVNDLYPSHFRQQREQPSVTRKPSTHCRAATGCRDRRVVLHHHHRALGELGSVSLVSRPIRAPHARCDPTTTTNVDEPRCSRARAPRRRDRSPSPVSARKARWSVRPERPFERPREPSSVVVGIMVARDEGHFEGIDTARSEHLAQRFELPRRAVFGEISRNHQMIEPLFTTLVAGHAAPAGRARRHREGETATNSRVEHAA